MNLPCAKLCSQRMSSKKYCGLYFRELNIFSSTEEICLCNVIFCLVLVLQVVRELVVTTPKTCIVKLHLQIIKGPALGAGTGVHAQEPW